ncbi:hypothetical protein LZ30DRAFT_774490 [Colletotrichum cereale]|nr:hypothetical protein LZ30DRAFT_774490 [Colletotrichum cereale]
MDFTMILAGNLEITPQVVAEAAEDYSCRAVAAYASRALEVADAIYSVAPVAPVAPVVPGVPGVLGVPGVPGVPGGLLLPDGNGQHHQGPGAAAELLMSRVQGFRPINGGHRDLAPPAEAKPPQPQDPPTRKKQQAEKVLCVCTFCTAGNAEGKWLSKKTKHEHEHGDRIDQNGEQVADEDRCDRCAKSNTRCVKSKDSAEKRPG